MPSQYQALQTGGPLKTVEYEKPSSPGPNEVIIRTKAVALNPADYKMLDYGMWIESFPTVLGFDAAGIIKAVGSDVQGFKAGDEVFAHCGAGNNRSGGFQDYIVLSHREIGLKPESWTFEEAASLPVAAQTAAAAIYDGLLVSIPFLGLSHSESNQHAAVLVLGGSSSVGSTTIEFLRLALPNSTIIATASAKHHDHVKSLGADTVLDYHSDDLVEQIKQALPDENTHVTGIVDAVNSLALQPGLLDVLKDSPQKNIAEVITGRNLAPEQIPEGVSLVPIYSATIAKSQPRFFELLGEFLASDEGRRKFKLPIPVDVVGNTWDAVGEGLKRLKEGVSGTKLVVSVQ